MLSEDKKSVYIHIPFCKTICSYCDFCKFYYNEKWINDYLKALKNEVLTNYKNEVINTIYIGGGTPSSLSIEYLKDLFEIINIFKIDKSFEFTFECNLNDITNELIEFLYKNKVNRISIGVESFNQNNLKFLNRNGSFKEAKEKIDICRNVGINNINVDLIYALPNQSFEELKSDLDKLVLLDVEHISTYSLMIENNTVLKNKHIEPIKEELDASMYQYICSYLKKNGYKHYEISNFSKKGYHSKHNLLYWDNKEYYGFGCGASGYINKVRYDNTRSLSDYTKGKYLLSKEELSKNDIMDYEIILGFRKLKGINMKDFYNKYHIKLNDKYPVDYLVERKELLIKGDYIRINPSKLYVMNEILIKLV